MEGDDDDDDSVQYMEDKKMTMMKRMMMKRMMLKMRWGWGLWLLHFLVREFCPTVRKYLLAVEGSGDSVTPIIVQETASVLTAVSTRRINTKYKREFYGDPQHTPRPNNGLTKRPNARQQGERSRGVQYVRCRWGCLCYVPHAVGRTFPSSRTISLLGCTIAVYPA